MMCVLSVLPGCGGRTECATHSDCAHSQERKDVGRCSHPDYACIDNACEAVCAAPCSLAREDVNPCAEGRICTQSVNAPTDAVCSSRPVACETEADCPSYRPGEGEWTCNAGTCEFPGFRYRSQ